VPLSRLMSPAINAINRSWPPTSILGYQAIQRIATICDGLARSQESVYSVQSRRRLSRERRIRSNHNRFGGGDST
jgi:hypothetical protein